LSYAEKPVAEVSRGREFALSPPQADEFAFHFFLRLTSSLSSASLRQMFSDASIFALRSATFSVSPFDCRRRR
jgi:hypothetical protein